MTKLIRILIERAKVSAAHLLILSSAIAVAPPLAPGLKAQDQSEHAAHQQAVPAKLVEDVRNATRQFADVNAATAANYQPFLGCISGPDQGAMGVHYVNGDLVGDGQIDVAHPEALIYEPVNGAMRLVGVEYIVDAGIWLTHHTGAPVLDGQVFQLITSPNRFGLATFFELHVWAWRNNPNGAFVDWNTKVTCEGQ